MDQNEPKDRMFYNWLGFGKRADGRARGIDNKPPGLVAARKILDKAEAKLSDLSDELNEMHDYIRYLRKSKKKTVFLIDFDVVVSSIDWLSFAGQNDGYDHNDPIWSALLLLEYCPHGRFPPGTMYELLKFLSKREKGIVAGFNRTQSSIVKAFENAFFSLSGENDDTLIKDIAQFPSLLRNFQSVSTVFVLSKLFSESGHDRFYFENVAYDLTIFRAMFDFLGNVKRRSQTTINNRVDAINYAIADYRPEIEANERAILVSNSRSLQRFPALPSDRDPARIDSDFRMNGVSSPRQACLFKILMRSTGNDLDKAVSISDVWKDDVESALSAIKRKKILLLLNRDFFVDSSDVNGLFINPIWQFGYIESQIEQVRREKRRSVSAFQKKFSVGEQEKLYREIHGYLQKNFDEKLFMDLVDKHRVIEAVSGDGLIEVFGRSCVLRTDGADHYISAKNESFAVWGDSIFTIFDFVTRCNSLKDTISRKIAGSIYRFDDPSVDVGAFNHDGSWLIHHKDGSIRIECQLSETVDIAEKLVEADLKGDDIEVITYSCPIFTASVDSLGYAITSRFDIVSDVISTIANVTVKGRASLQHDPNEEALYSCLSDTKLIEPSLAT